jgi:hypothetical protein
MCACDAATVIPPCNATTTLFASKNLIKEINQHDGILIPYRSILLDLCAVLEALQKNSITAVGTYGPLP